jgi:hypothetical protein
MKARTVKARTVKSDVRAADVVDGVEAAVQNPPKLVNRPMTMWM